jgi:hypothetical protein
MKIVQIEGDELADLLWHFGQLVENSESIHTLRVTIDEDGDEAKVKFQANEGAWSPGYGESR